MYLEKELRPYFFAGPPSPDATEAKKKVILPRGQCATRFPPPIKRRWEFKDGGSLQLALTRTFKTPPFAAAWNA